MSSNNVTEYDAQMLTDFCKRTNTNNALFYNDLEPSIVFNAKRGEFLSLSLTKESPVIKTSIKRQEVYYRNEKFLVTVANVKNLTKVIVDETNLDYPNFYIVFSGCYRDSEDELYNALYDYKLGEKSKPYNVIPLSISEFDENTLPHNAIIFTRKHANVH